MRGVILTGAASIVAFALGWMLGVEECRGHPVPGAVANGPAVRGADEALGVCIAGLDRAESVLHSCLDHVTETHAVLVRDRSVLRACMDEVRAARATVPAALGSGAL